MVQNLKAQQVIEKKSLPLSLSPATYFLSPGATTIFIKKFLKKRKIKRRKCGSASQ